MEERVGKTGKEKKKKIGETAGRTKLERRLRMQKE